MLNNKMNLMLISPMPPPAGGIATWTKQYLENSKRFNLNVELVNTSLIGNRGIQVNSNRSLISEVKRTYQIIKSTINKIKLNNIEIVHLNTSCSNYGILRDVLIASIIKRKKIPLVIHYRCNIEDQVKNSVSERALKKLVKFASVNLVLNNESKRTIEKNSNNVMLVPNFIDEDFLIKKPKDIKNKVRNALFVGHVQRTKGIFEIIEVAIKFPEIEFQIIGPIKDKEIINLAPKNMNFLGEIIKEEIRDYMLNSDFFIFPTYTEGFSNALLEAMSVGLPIITTNVGANNEMLENKGGIVIPPKDIKALANSIDSIRGVNLRKKMSEFNIIKVSENYTINKVMEKYTTIYKHLKEPNYEFIRKHSK